MLIMPLYRHMIITCRLDQMSSMQNLHRGVRTREWASYFSLAVTHDDRFDGDLQSTESAICAKMKQGRG